MISKELLSAVLGVKVVEIYKEKGEIYRYRRYKEEIDGCHIHNIYELAHKCKEWAIDLQGGSAYFIRSGNYVDWFCETGFTNGFDTKKFIADTEQEAIFKACEWILSNK